MTDTAKKQKMKDNLKKFANIANRFVQSDYFIIFNAAFILIGWAFEVWAPMLCALVVINILPLFFFKDTKHLLSLIMMFTIIISSYRHNLQGFSWLLVLIIVLFAGIIFSLVRFRREFKPLTPTNIKGFHCSLIALIIPFALGGAASPTENVYAILAALAFAVVYSLGYSFFVVTNRDNTNKDKLMEYIIKVLFVMGVVICAEVIIFLVSSCENFEQAKAILTGKKINLGWAGSNNVAPVLAMSVPATLYLCIKKNYATPLFVVIAVVEYIIVFVTGSRGSVLLLTLCLVPMILYVIVKSQNKLLFGITLSAVVAVGIVLVGYFGNEVSVFITKMLNMGLSDNGRKPLYRNALEAFKQNPFFGQGWDYKLGQFQGDGYSPYYFHCTVLQIMANMGVVGLIGFAFFYFWRYRTFIVLRKRPEALVLLTATLLMDGYGMVDTTFFSPTFFLMLLVLTLVVELNIPDNKCRAFGGRNPFKDMVCFAKWCVSSIKTRSKKGAVQGAQNVVVDGLTADTQDNASLLNQDENAAVNNIVDQSKIDDGADNDLQ